MGIGLRLNVGFGYWLWDTFNLVFTLCMLSLAYSIAKYGMSLCVLGMAEELKSAGIAVNALWTQTGQ